MPTAHLKALVLVFAGGWLHTAAAAADLTPTDSTALTHAATLLSRFPEGEVPVESGVVTAIGVLGDQGGLADVALLASLAARERTEIHDAAVQAIGEIHQRQRELQREAFARALPEAPELRHLTQDLVQAGLGAEEAICIAYARRVLEITDGSTPALAAPPHGDSATLLAEGRPAVALALAAAERDEHTAALAAADLGDPSGAVRRLARLAADDDAHAHEALAGWGIDAERLLLGWMSGRVDRASAPNEARVLDVLVRRGGRLTVSVLVEHTRGPVASERATAVDALARMVDGAGRTRPLPPIARDEAVRALRRVSLDTPDPVRGVALAAMAQLAAQR